MGWEPQGLEPHGLGATGARATWAGAYHTVLPQGLVPLARGNYSIGAEWFPRSRLYYTPPPALQADSPNRAVLPTALCLVAHGSLAGPAVPVYHRYAPPLTPDACTLPAFPPLMTHMAPS